MALELLAGPFPVTVGKYPIPDELEPGRFSSGCFWVDDLGLVGPFRGLGGTRSHVAVGQLDGPAYLRSHLIGNDPNLVFDATTNQLLDLDTIADRLVEFNPISCIQGETVESGWTGVFTNFIKLSDRYVRLSRLFGEAEYRVLSSPHGGSGKRWTQESVPLSGDPSYGRVSVLNNRVICFGSRNGVINLYDTVEKAEVGQWRTIAMENVGLWASPRFGIFISLHDTNGPSSQQEIRVWADEVRPGSVSDPEALDPILQGRMSRIRTRVMGADGEVCPNQLVDWEITQGLGSLGDRQSETDSDGYAETTYYASVTSLEDVVIKSEVVF